MIKQLLFLFAIFLMLGCKKERIEMNLYDKGGEWNIKEYYVSARSENPNVDSYFEKMYDFGKMTFQNGGQFRMELGQDEEVTFYVGSFHVEKSKLILTSNAISEEFKMTWTKNNVHLSREIIDYDGSGYKYVFRVEYKLKKY